MRRCFEKLIFSVLLGIAILACSHNPNGGPWSLIRNEVARGEYMRIQASAEVLTYEEMYQSIKALSARYPDEEVITITRAGLYGDYGQTLSPEEEKQYKRRALETLKPFAQKTYLNEVSQARVLALNQYYYHSGQFKKQMEYGKEVTKKGGRGGEVLVAVGGSMHALALDRQNKILQARVTALEARQMWESLYDLSIPQMREAAHKNSYYVSSLALTGECFLAQDLFDTKIKTSKRYPEMERWYQQFNPQNLNNCQSNLRQLTAQ